MRDTESKSVKCSCGRGWYLPVYISKRSTSKLGETQQTVYITYKCSFCGLTVKA